MFAVASVSPTRLVFFKSLQEKENLKRTMAPKTAEVNKARIQRIEAYLGTSDDDELAVNTVRDSI